MPNITNTTSTTTTTRRRVTFHPRVRCVDIMGIEDYTPKEISASWFSEEEMHRITNQCFKLLKRMDAGKAGRYCTRGLEGHVGVGRITKKKNRANSIASVLVEQSNQWIDDDGRVVDDEQAIADAYQKVTSSCQMWAQVMGKRDQEAADIILFDHPHSLVDDEAEGQNGGGASKISNDHGTLVDEPFTKRYSPPASSSSSSSSSSVEAQLMVPKTFQSGMVARAA